MAISVYLELKDEGGAKIPGGCDKSKRKEMMECVEYTHRIYLPTDPVDGTIKGNRRHEPIRVAKIVDKATPLLYGKCAQGSTLKEAVFHFYQITPKGEEVEFYNVKLTDCKIIGMSQRVLNTREYENMPHLDDIDFNYKRIEWHYIDGNITALDDYKDPK